MYFLSVAVNLINCCWLPVRVHAELLPLCCQICLAICMLNRTGNGSIWKKLFILLGCFTDGSALWSSSLLGCSNSLASRVERELRWRSCFNQLKYCFAGHKPHLLLLCYELVVLYPGHLMDQRHIMLSFCLGHSVLLVLTEEKKKIIVHVFKNHIFFLICSPEER